MALEHTKGKKNRNQILNKINYVRLRKKTYLPFELLRLDGITQTKCYDNMHEESQCKWCFKFPPVKKPKGKVVKEWREFIKQMKQQCPKIVYDFKTKEKV